MALNQKSKTFVMVILFLLASFTTFASGDETESLARSTGNEEIIISVTGDYYDRGGEFTFTITSKNLDPNSEYTLTWELCAVYSNQCEFHEGGNDPAETEGTIDLGSGNAIQVSTITFTDPGLYTSTLDPNDPGGNIYIEEGIENNSYRFEGKLSIQGVQLDENLSNLFVLGGEVYSNSYLNGNGNLIKNMPVPFNGRFYLDWQNYNILDFDINCGLYEGTGTTPVDTYDFASKSTSGNYINFNYGAWNTSTVTAADLVPTASSGTHHIECSITRLADSTVMHTIIGDDFEVIDADITGLEEFRFQSLPSSFYERTTSTTTTQTTVSVDFTDLYPGETYLLTWELCTVYSNHCEFHEGGNDPVETDGTITFTPTTATHTETFTFEDPGLYTSTLDPNDPGGNIYIEEGIENNSYRFEGKLSIQGVQLDENLSNLFVLGGEVYSNSYLNGNGNLIKNMPVPFNGRFYLDWQNYNILDFDINCGLYEGTGTTPVDTYDFASKSTSGNYINFNYGAWNTSTVTAADLVPTASSGTHHIECSITRLADSTVMHTIIGDDFEVIDADITGLEEFRFQSLPSSFYERTTSTTTTQTTVSVDFTDLYPGETYLLTWELCTVYSNHCEFHEGGNDPVETDGTITFTPTTATHTETFTFEDPGLYTSTLDPNDPGGNIYIEEGIENNSYRFEGKLSIQGVQLDENLSNLFVLGGEVYSNSYLNGNGNLIKNMPVPFNGRFYLDWQNYNILDFDINCGLYEGTGTTPVDTYDFASKSTSGNYINFNYGAWNTSTVTAADLVPTASSGTHHIECSITRLADSTVMHTIIGDDFEVIDDTSNQDDASMAVSVAMHATEGWGTVTISAVDLDAGQEYRFNWVVNDTTTNPATVMIQNDHIWVAGNDGTHTYDLPFHDLADTTDACITVVFKAGTTELATDSTVCWISASTADADGDGVYDKNDLCENTPASATVQSDGCSDSDGDGVDSTIETECGSDPNDINSVPTDLDNDGTCDLLDTDADGDGALNVDEIAAGTDPMDANSFPSNMLPTCAVYYSLEVDGMPTSFDGDAAIPALSGATAQAGVNSLTPPVITVPAGSYYITAHCIDTDGDDITVTVNDISVGPVAGEVSAGAIIVIGEDVDETLDVTISWTDGTDTLTAIITVNMDGDSGPTTIPGFGFMLGMMSIMLAGFVAIRRKE